MTTRQYSSRSQQSTLTSAITAGATSITVVSGSTLLGGVTIPAGRTFTLVIDPDTALEEIVDATANPSSNTFTISRAIDGSTAQSHSAGAVVRHMAIGRDLRDANLHAEATGSYNDGSGNAHTMHGIGSGEGDVVGTAKTQTLTNKTLTAPTISDPVITGVIGGAGITFEGSTADAHETTLTVADPTQDNTITLPNTTGTVVIDSATQTLTNKTLTSPTISGSPVITGLSSAGMVASSAAPKDYVDSILGSATSAATSAASAATSAASAATSASSAATSASSALTSANSASTSATAAATSATSAAASATAAATSATSASNSASAASTSASSADTSASSASTSASSALTSANSASTSASSALTSANSAATSASSAATSYDSFDDRYLGAKASPPSVDNDGNALLTGALYWNTGSNQMFVWSGSAWVEISSTAEIYRFRYTAAGGETSESGPDDNGVTLSYLVGKEQVYLNGVLLVRNQDYTASTGNSITGLSPALSSGDVLEIITFSAFSLANTISNTIFDAKGDLLTASGADTPARLATGSNDQVLVADSTQSTGLAWKSVATPFAAGKNKIINGDFGIWQRGTSFSIASGYTADRYTFDKGGSSVNPTISQQTFTPGTAPVAGYEGQYFYRSAQATAGTGQVYNNIITQKIEDVRTFAGQTVTLSFWAKSDAARSFLVSIYQIFGSGGSGAVGHVSNSFTSSTSWTRYTYTVTLGSMSGKTIGTGSTLEVTLSSNVLNTAQTWDIWGVQLEAGNVATPFQTATGTLQGELAACKRYYEKSYELATVPASATALGAILGSCNAAAATTGSLGMGYWFTVEKRGTPTITIYDTAGNSGKCSRTSLGFSPSTNQAVATFNAATTGFGIESGSSASAQAIHFHYVASAEL